MNTILLQGPDGSVYLVNDIEADQNFEEKAKLLPQLSGASTWAWLDDDHLAIIGKRDGLDIFEWQDGKVRLLNSYTEEGLSPHALAVNADDQLIALSSAKRSSLLLYEWDSDLQISHLDELSLRSKGGESSRPHLLKWSPDQKWLIASDYGTNQLYSLEVVKKAILREVESLDLGEDFTMSDFTFHPSLNIAYALSEYKAELLTMEYEPDTGAFTPFLTMSSLPNHVVEIEASNEKLSSKQFALNARGDQLFVLNEKYPSIASYKLHPRVGASQFDDLLELGDFDPLDLSVDSNSATLYVTSKSKDYFITYKKDKQSGKWKKDQKINNYLPGLRFFI